MTDIFKKLDAQELRQLAKYLRSPLFNKQVELVRLFDWLRKKGGRYDEAEVFRHLYPNEVFDKQKLHHANSFLLKHIHAYLAWREWSDGSLLEDLALLRVFRKKQLDKAFDRQFLRIKKQLDSSPLRNEQYHELRYRLFQEQFLHDREKGRAIEFNLQALSDAQDTHYIADKLKAACTMLTHQTMMRREYDKGLLGEVLGKVEASPSYLDSPAIAAYYHAFKALSDLKNETAFQRLKALFPQKIQCFSPEEQRDIYILSINYCIRRLNSGSQAFIREAFDLYRQGLGARVFIEHGILSRWTYNNIIVLGLKLSEYDWVEGFIHQYKDNLEEKYRWDSFHFNLAKFHFEKREYDKAMPLLVQTKYDDLLHVLGARTMLAKMYYELSEWDTLDSLLESFKTYIQRKENIGYHKENYLNIISFIKKIAHLNPFDTKGIETLRREIQGTVTLTERTWLLRKLGEL